jgi:hypothetical protein
MNGYLSMVERAKGLSRTGSRGRFAKKGGSCLDELYQFLAQRAKDTGHHDHYLALQLTRGVDHLTLE